MSAVLHTRSLLVELFVEELPPKALKKLGESFAQLLADGLRAQNLSSEHSVVTGYASPRRLAVHISAVAAVAPDEELVTKLMPVSVAIGEGSRPSDALRRRLAKEGREYLADLWPQASQGPDGLFTQSDGKVEALYLSRLVKGVMLSVGLQRALDEAIAKLPIPKLMTYQLADGWSSVQFVRPVHALVALHGPDVVPVHALGLDAGRETHGHRFEAAMDPVVLQHADHYAQQLADQGAVIPGYAQRRSEIIRQIQHAASKAGLTPIEDEALLDEVNSLVERPNVLLGRFDEDFLQVPQECLILTMKANQKYFPLLDANGRLSNQFLIVSNIRPDDPSAVIGGNERVVRPRLADARFFFDQDRKRTLESRLPGLDKVVYHGKLGSQGERTARVQAIARSIGHRLGGDTLAQQAGLAARLAKADLLTDMVGEFPDLQGIMGRYYAQHDGLPEAIAYAIEDHYRPRFAGDDLPRNEVGVVVALADKLETLVGLFGIGQIPTGDKDPFALRRHALGVVRLLTERAPGLDLADLLDIGAEAFPAGMLADARAELRAFVMERFAGLLRERGASAHEVDALLSLAPTRLDRIASQLEAVRAFGHLPEAASLAAANKRVTNILKKAGHASPPALNAALLTEPAERALAQALAEVGPVADTAFGAGDYTASLQSLAALKLPVDAFFDQVMVNAEDPALRANRLALLAALHTAMNRIADLSKLAA